MNSLRVTSLLSLFSFCLLLYSVVAIDPLFNICSSSNKYTSGDPFGNNLNQLMFLLATRSPPIGFGLGSVGQGIGRVNGLALCRGDVTSSTCTNCIRTADAQIRQLCPFKKEAIIWFDECLLRYSDTEFFGEIDNKGKFYMLSPLLFATEEVEIGQSEKLYGLAQCTKELSGGDCKKCLENVIRELPSCCKGKQGGRVVGGSCNIRYELYPFFDT